MILYCKLRFDGECKYKTEDWPDYTMSLMKERYARQGWEIVKIVEGEYDSEINSQIYYITVRRWKTK